MPTLFECLLMNVVFSRWNHLDTTFIMEIATLKLFRHWINVEYQGPSRHWWKLCLFSFYWTRRSVRNAKQANNIYPAGFKPTVSLLTLTHWTTLSLDPRTHPLKPISSLYISYIKHVATSNRLCLICRIHRIVNSNGFRLKLSIRKLANILQWMPLVMWRKIDIDFFNFKGVIVAFA